MIRTRFVSLLLTAALAFAAVQIQTMPAFAGAVVLPTPTPTPCPPTTFANSGANSQTALAVVVGPPTCPTTGAGSSATSVMDVANARYNQMITNRVLGTVLLGVNEQVNCNDCVSAFGSAGSFSAGVHGRKNITPSLSLLAGIAYTQYGEGGYNVTSAPIGALALRYDFVEWGVSRPFFEIGTILSPFQDVRYRRSYVTSSGPVSLESRTQSEDYGVYGRAGWIYRFSARDEFAVSGEIWQLWQRVDGYVDPAASFNPFAASIATGTDRTNLFKIGGQWTHLFGTSVEANLNGGYVQSFSTRSGIVATVTDVGTVTPTVGNQGWFEMGARLGFRITTGMVADVFVNGTAGPKPVGNTVHGGVGLRISY